MTCEENLTVDTSFAKGSAQAGHALVEIDGLSLGVGAGDRMATPLQQVSFDIPEGGTVGLVGESGSGKSLTAAALIGLLPRGMRVTGGEVRFRGRNVFALSETERRKLRGSSIAMVFQNPKSSLNPLIPVGDQVAEVVRLHQGLDKASAQSQAIDLLDRMGIPNAKRRAEDYPHQYSGGMAQRAALARAMACQPEILIADEPTTGLDATVQRDVLDLLNERVATTGVSILLISHDVRAIRSVCAETVVMYAGTVLEAGPTDLVWKEPRSPYTRALRSCEGTGVSGRMNTIPGAAPIVTHPHKGCPFADRCDLAEDRCASERPMTRTTQHRRFACHLVP